MKEKCPKCGKPIIKWYALGAGEVLGCEDIECGWYEGKKERFELVS